MKRAQFFLFLAFISISGLSLSVELHQKINKQELTQKIKGLIIDELHYEMYVLVDASIHHYSQGNKELGEDIIDLHNSFSNNDLVQTKLDAFCAKWNLIPIKIDEIIRARIVS